MESPVKRRRCWSVLPIVLVLGASLLAASETALGQVVFFLFLGVPTLFGPAALGSSVVFLLSLPAPTFRPRNAEGQLCEAASLFNEHEKAHWIRTREATRAFEAACRRALASLEPAARAELDGLLREGALTRVLPEESSSPGDGYSDDWRTCGSRFVRRAEGELEGGALELYRRIGVAPLRERFIEASEVRGALQRAEVARFDARGLIPARLFNASIQELHALHPGADVVVHSTSDGLHGLEAKNCVGLVFAMTTALSRTGPGSLLEWLLAHGFTEAILRNVCHRHWTLREMSSAMRRFEPAEFSFGDTDAEFKAKSDHYGMLAYIGRAVWGSNINVLRLPNWTRGEVDTESLAAALGLGGQVEHAHNFLWTGASPGGIHSDVQDNVLVQISGFSDIFIVPANCSLGFDRGMNTSLRSVTATWIKEKGPDLPFFLITLRPGDGVAIPSNALHTVMSKDPKRIGMNFFFEPRYGQMRWPEAPANFYNHAPEGRLAMRALWVKAVREMWAHREAGAPSFILHGQRQEIV